MTEAPYEIPSDNDNDNLHSTATTTELCWSYSLSTRQPS